MVKSLACISDKVQITRRYARSVDLARDASDPDALQGYVVTSSVREATSRILSGLKPNSTQKAFRVTGPYGSGKSAFGLFLSQLLASEADALSISERVGIDVPDGLPSFETLILVGKRTSFTLDLLDALRGRAEERDDQQLLLEIERVRSLSNDKGHRPTQALKLLEKFAHQLNTDTGRGLAVFVDEMGRYIEFAAAHPGQEDPSVFQMLAERAGGAQSSPLAVIAFLHHRFADYVAGLGDWVEAEWTRSAERYEEIAFHETAEQSLYLLSEALEHLDGPQKDIIKTSQDLYAEARNRDVFSLSLKELKAVSQSLYPLHPSVASTLAAIGRRFGQNERSIFGFLQTLEPHGFQQFAQNTLYKADNWYRLPELFDYLSNQGDIRFRSADRERRWQLAIDAVHQIGDLDDADNRVLKTLAIISVFEPLSGLKSDTECLSWLLGSTEPVTCSAIGRLVERGLIYERPHQGDFSLWSSTSVDLDGLLTEARIRVPAIKRLDFAAAGIETTRPLIAHRHYHQLGTLRAFSIVERVSTKVETDGRIIVVPVHPDEDPASIQRRTKKFSKDEDSLTIFRVVKVKPEDLAWAHELALWNWVKQNCPELRVDDLARSEVEARIAEAQSAVLHILENKGDVGLLSPDDMWFHKGTLVDIFSRGNLSRLLSDICDEVFAETPILRNELINRAKLSTAIASARMRLLELMITKESSSYLGLEGAPPERTIYLSLLRESGMHVDLGNGEFAFSKPSDDPLKWLPAWELIEAMVGSKETVRFNELLDALSKPPFGLNAGPALIFLATFMLVRRRDVALMERNTFQPELSGAHFMRLAKAPKNFSLSYLGASYDRRDVLERLPREITILSDVGDKLRTVKDTAEALYRWWAKLPPCTRDTSSISKRAQNVRSVIRKAQNPVKLFFVDLPLACGALEAEGTIDVDQYLLQLDATTTELADIEPTLRSMVRASLLRAFGVSSMKRLKAQVVADFAPYLLQLTEYQPRQFVERLVGDLDEDRCLDGLTGLLVGRRLESWKDGDIDTFAFEVRSIADRLARWLVAVRREMAQDGNLRTLHIVSTTGHEEVMIIRGGDSPQSELLEKKLRALLENEADAEVVLSKLLAERLEQSSNKTKAKT